MQTVPRGELYSSRHMHEHGITRVPLEINKPQKGPATILYISKSAIIMYKKGCPNPLGHPFLNTFA